MIHVSIDTPPNPYSHLSEKNKEKHCLTITFTILIIDGVVIEVQTGSGRTYFYILWSTLINDDILDLYSRNKQKLNI